MRGNASKLGLLALELDELTKRYRRGVRPALDRVTIGVQPGSIVALVGPNGAGKSTLIRCCLGYERPTFGRVLVFGIDPARDPVRALGAIGYVGQSPGLYRDLSAREHIELAGALRPTFDREMANARIKDLGIDPRVATRHLSGGEQVQIALALALATRAPLLLLDEPLASLDPLARRDFLGVVRDAVSRTGATCVLSSHIVGDLSLICDRLVVLAPARVMIDASILDAKREHTTSPLDAVRGREIVGVFADDNGRPTALLRSNAGDEPASLDEVVLGYLASTRRSTRTA
ncbi:MAG TPA: ABC transporter ATP-binding protein [Candidatus Limnocylindrales bacterium]|nr:ABC transporter ATP-binding protein [Candidatus Limnocylindrales bacterium]